MISCLILLNPVHNKAAEWERLPFMPVANGGFACELVGDDIVVAGGTNWVGGVKNWLDEVHVFSLPSRSWSRVGRLPSAQAYALSGLMPGRSEMLLHGGTTGQGRVSEWRVISASGLVRVLPSAATPSVLAAGGLIGGWLLQVGGTDDAANLPGLCRTAQAVDFVSGQVQALPDYPGAPFGTAASVVVGEELLIFGGANWDGQAGAVCNAKEAHAFDWKTRTWRPLAPLPYPVRGITARLVAEGVVYLAGGYKGDAEGFTDEAWFYDIAQDAYQPAPPLPYRGMVALVDDGRFLFCLGGEHRQKDRTKAFFRRALADILAARETRSGSIQN